MLYYVQIFNRVAFNNPALLGEMHMYKTDSIQQMTFEGFNQSCGMKLNRNDIWILIADKINWDAVEAEYSKSFTSRRGRPAVTSRQALGAMIIKSRTHLSDRALVDEIGRNPYYQYLIGLEAFQSECPFKHGVLPELRKRISADFLMRINDTFLKEAQPTAEHKKDKADKPAENGNAGTMLLDATCSPVNIRFPQDFSLLNEAREKLDSMIDILHGQRNEKRRPRTYRRVLRKKFLAMAKSKKRTAKKMRSTVYIMLCAVKRNLEFVDAYLAKGGILSGKDMEILNTIRKLYRQQKEMFDNKTHRVQNRIVSITQPYIRPVVRGKEKAPVEFGPKYDVSVDEQGHGRLEKVSFDPYNECTILISVLEKYKERTGHYPKRVLVDKIYRTRENRTFCERNGIVMSGRKSGRPPKDDKERRTAEKNERKNDIDRIEVERFFSVSKRNCGAGLIMTKLSQTTLGSVALTILVANLFGVPMPIFLFFFMDSQDGKTSCHWIEIEDDEKNEGPQNGHSEFSEPVFNGEYCA